MDVVKELANLALNQVNIRIRRGDVMRIIAEGVTDTGTYVFHLGPKAPETRVFGPDVVGYHNKQIEPEHRHAGLIQHAEQLAEQSRRDEAGRA